MQWSRIHGSRVAKNKNNKEFHKIITDSNIIFIVYYPPTIIIFNQYFNYFKLEINRSYNNVTKMTLINYT